MIAPESYQKIIDLLNQGIQQNLFTAAQCVIADPKAKRISIALGKTRLDRYPARYQCPVCNVNEHTLFDVASLTKPLATSALIMKAMDEGILQPQQKLISIIRGTLPSWLLGYTLEDLLTHSTPLTAWADFHHEHVILDSHEHAVKRVLSEINAIPPRTDTDTCCYSDLGFIILGYILELIYNTSLDKLFAQKIARPLGLQDDMMFLPLHHVDDKRCVATHPFIGGYALQGHPDDDNTRAMVHVAGHAGLFATANAIADEIDALLHGHFPVSEKTIHYFTTYQAEHSTYALGWDRPTSSQSLSGRLPGEPVIGHLGYTGCSLWIDLQSKRHITLLTNRSHVNTDPASIAQLRRAIYQLAWEL